MPEDPYVIQMNIEHYEALLKREMDDRKRRIVRQMLNHAKLALALTQNEKI